MPDIFQEDFRDFLQALNDQFHMPVFDMTLECFLNVSTNDVFHLAATL
ncbi:MAG: hypothetical protein IT249_03630 [Chitinophagaceae bacterium]|nr:hypothetical protein [Chitinophagaceae bacterium]